MYSKDCHHSHHAWQDSFINMVCPKIHWKKSWRKTPPAWPDVTDSLVRGTENFFDMKIELIRRVPTTKTEYFEIIGISRRFFVLPRRSFPTLFRHLSDELIIKNSTSGTRPTFFRVTIHYSTTAPHSLWVQCDSTNFYFLSTCRTIRNTSICKHLWSPGFHSEESISPG